MPLSGQALRVARRAHGLSRGELADQLGKTRKTVDFYEQGRLQPSLRTLERMAAVLGISVEDLLEDVQASRARQNLAPTVEDSEVAAQVAGALKTSIARSRARGPAV